MLGGALRDDPEAYIPGDRRRALAAGRELPDRTSGAALFADISGFTPLTEALALELGPQRGAEELTAILEQVFAAVLGELHDYGGSVISFSGDAVTCWLDGDDGLLAAACALRMQATMDRVGQLRTPGGRDVRLAMKVAVAVGSARRCVVGEPDIQLIDVLAGALMDDLAAAERRAGEGQVVLTPATAEALAARADVHDGVLRALRDDVPLPEVRPPPEPLPEDVVRQWLLPPVYERMRAGRGEFLAELRPAIPLFLRFGGLDFDTDDAAPARLDAFIRRAQQVIDTYGGSTLQLTVGDKGSYLYAVFGSPIAHEDDAARVCGAALDLLALAADAPVHDFQIGVSQGRLRSGTYGHRQRRTFCCLGDAVNLAARLMSAAPPGSAWVADVVRQAAGSAYRWTALPELTVKGKAEPVTVWELAGRTRATASTRPTKVLVGRAAELRTLLDWAEPAVTTGRGVVIGVSGEAGVGKSRLLLELATALGDRGVRSAHGIAQAYGTSASYAAWQSVWRTLLDLDGVPDDEVPAALADTLPDGLRARAPLLGALLGLPLPDTELTARFDAKLRKTSLESMAVRLLADRAAATSVLIVLEDAQRLDALSQDLLVVLARAVAELPVVLALAYRPGPAYGGVPLEGLPHAREFALAALDTAATERAVIARLQHLYGTDRPLSPRLVAALAERSEGNPLYVRELCAYLHDRELDPGDEATLADAALPESLHSLMLSRIDTLAEAPRRAAKVASVVGRSFREQLLPRAYPELGDVAPAVAELVAGDVVELEDAEPATHSFTHSIGCDVAYQSVPFALRLDLHEAVARCLEAGDDGDPARQLDRLAYHYGRSRNVDKQREYLLAAGIAAQADYANAAALDHFGRLLPLLPEAERPPILLRIGKVLELTGEWVRAAAVYAEALELSDRYGDATGSAWARTWRAETARKQGRYDEAAAGLADAGEAFRVLTDEAGVGQVLHLRGTLAAQTGDYPAATAAYRESLAIRERLGDLASQGALLSNLAIVEEYQGRYADAQALGEQALELRLRDGDPWAIGISQNNLGMIAVLRGNFAVATERFAESMRLNQLVGDGWMVALVHHNLGNALRGLGDVAAAGREYVAALVAFRGYADDWALALLYEDVAQLAARTGAAATAARLLGVSEATRERIGAPRAPDIQEQLAPVVSGLHDALGPAYDEARRDGRRLDAPAADDLVRAATQPA